MAAMSVWTFGPADDSSQTYASGDVVPHRAWAVLCDGVKVGELECHMHKRRGSDGKIDTSFGITAVAFGPPQAGN